MVWYFELNFNPSSVNPTKWSNTLTQFVCKLPTSCLSVFDHFVRLALKALFLVNVPMCFSVLQYSTTFVAVKLYTQQGNQEVTAFKVRDHPFRTHAMFLKNYHFLPPDNHVDDRVRT